MSNSPTPACTHGRSAEACSECFLAAIPTASKGRLVVLSRCPSCRALVDASHDPVACRATRPVDATKLSTR